MAPLEAEVFVSPLELYISAPITVMYDAVSERSFDLVHRNPLYYVTLYQRPTSRQHWTMLRTP